MYSIKIKNITNKMNIIKTIINYNKNKTLGEINTCLANNEKIEIFDEDNYDVVESTKANVFNDFIRFIEELSKLECKAEIYNHDEEIVELNYLYNCLESYLITEYQDEIDSDKEIGEYDANQDISIEISNFTDKKKAFEIIKKYFDENFTDGYIESRIDGNEFNIYKYYPSEEDIQRFNNFVDEIKDVSSYKYYKGKVI